MDSSNVPSGIVATAIFKPGHQWVETSQYPVADKSKARTFTGTEQKFSITQPCGEDGRCGLLAVVFLNYLNRGAHVAGDFEHPIPFRSAVIE
jgi:hypothetical protein